MEKLFNTVSVTIALIGGMVVKFLGGGDTLLKVLLTLIIIDYLTGVAKAIITKTVSSKIGFIGLFKKVLILVVIGVAVTISKVIGDTVPIREIVIMFYIANEGISFLENASEFIPLPKRLKEVFIQIRDKGNYDESDNDYKEG
jgi:toxin secretion/phage lysis holin